MSPSFQFYSLNLGTTPYAPYRVRKLLFLLDVYNLHVLLRIPNHVQDPLKGHVCMGKTSYITKTSEPLAYMNVTRMISIRLSEVDFEILEQEAARHHKPVSAFARERLMSHVRWNRDLTALRNEVLQDRAARPNSEEGAMGQAGVDHLLLEALLLLRRAAPPQTLAQVHGEMARYGFATFQLRDG